jgi:alpha-1,3-rhamnosyl/mannosyltransferase
MALGAPVIAANATALPEVVADAGHLLDLSVDTWADAVRDVIARRSGWQDRGRVRAAQFTALESGRDLAQVYRTVAAGGR